MAETELNRTLDNWIEIGNKVIERANGQMWLTLLIIIPNIKINTIVNVRGN